MAVTTSKRPADERTPSAGPIRTTVVLPAYNEGAALPHVLDELGQYLDSSYEVLVVDDGSNDDTAEVAERYPVRLIRHASNRGKRSEERRVGKEDRARRRTTRDK